MEREHEEFFRWVQTGGLAVPDSGTEEGRIAWTRLHGLYEFSKWIVARQGATVTEVMPYELVAADGPDDRRWKPEGGLGIKDWPYLKACCCPWDDEDFVQILRDELMEAILTSHLQGRGYSFVVAGSAVDDLAGKLDASGKGPLWEAVEKLPFERVIAALEGEALRIREELEEYRRTHAGDSYRHPDGPQSGKRRLFWLGGTPYHLSKLEFGLVSVLWPASERSLPLEDVYFKLWGRRAIGIQDEYAHDVRVLGGRLAAKVGNITISVPRDPNQMGLHYRVVLDIL